MKTIKTLKILVKLILNCSRRHEITYTKKYLDVLRMIEKLSALFGKFRKMFENVCLAFDNFREIFGKCSDIFGKSN